MKKTINVSNKPIEETQTLPEKIKKSLTSKVKSLFGMTDTPKRDIEKEQDYDVLCTKKDHSKQ